MRHKLTCRLQHLCHPAADLSNGNKIVQATAPAVEVTPQQSLAQVMVARLPVSTYLPDTLPPVTQLLRHQAAAISAVDATCQSGLALSSIIVAILTVFANAVWSGSSSSETA